MPLRSLATGHCIVVSDRSPFLVLGKLWMEGLYFRKKKSSRSDLDFTLSAKDGAELWLSNVVVQGTGADECTRCGLDASDGTVHAEGEILHIGLRYESNMASVKHVLSPFQSSNWKYCHTLAFTYTTDCQRIVGALKPEPYYCLNYSAFMPASMLFLSWKRSKSTFAMFLVRATPVCQMR